MIAVITPSIREPELELNRQSLALQTFRDFKWYVCSPFEYKSCDVWIPEPPRNEGDFMGENKAYNAIFDKVEGDLIVTLNDSLWLKGNALEKFWEYYQKDPLSCVAMMGNHYAKVENGLGSDMTYEDVRRSSFTQPLSSSTITNFDACCSSFPVEALKKAGKIDPMWDKYCCFGPRELMFKIRALGYSLYISSESGYLGQKHEKKYDPNNTWDIKFKEGKEIWEKMYEKS